MTGDTSSQQLTASAATSSPVLTTSYLMTLRDRPWPRFVSFSHITYKSNFWLQVKIEVGWGGQTTILTGITDMKIHPNYTLNDNDDTIGSTDVALIKTTQDIFTISNGSPEPSNIAPICLPPKLGYIPEGTNDQNVFEPFEDLDCQKTTGRK